MIKNVPKNTLLDTHIEEPQEDTSLSSYYDHTSSPSQGPDTPAFHKNFSLSLHDPPSNSRDQNPPTKHAHPYPIKYSLAFLLVSLYTFKSLNIILCLCNASKASKISAT